MNRGDVILVRILVRFPRPSGLRGKKRPAVVVQSDAYTGAAGTLVVAEVTKNPTMASDPSCMFIDTSTPEGRATGLVRDSVVSCLVLVTVYADRRTGTGNAFAGYEAEARWVSDSGAGAALSWVNNR
jgi:mRNA-degrading endonuclease toxin of MazEF toxin-antitoxin module